MTTGQGVLLWAGITLTSGMISVVGFMKNQSTCDANVKIAEAKSTAAIEAAKNGVAIPTTPETVTVVGEKRARIHIDI